MTYWQYHLVFTLPLLCILLWLNRSKIQRGHLFAWAIVSLIVFAFTTPWDNYAVFLGIWYFGPGVSLGYPLHPLAASTPLIGHIPFEEYAYFWIESTLACLALLFFLPPRRSPNN